MSRRQHFELPSKVLFVDNEKDFVQTVSTRFNQRDVGTYRVYSGLDAFALVEEDCPDVMVLDFKMPGVGGIEVLQKTKQRAPKVEVIILTGHGSAQKKESCMNLGAYVYLNKPVDMEELSKVIKAANSGQARQKAKGGAGLVRPGRHLVGFRGSAHRGH